MTNPELVYESCLDSGLLVVVSPFHETVLTNGPNVHMSVVPQSTGSHGAPVLWVTA